MLTLAGTLRLIFGWRTDASRAAQHGTTDRTEGCDQTARVAEDEERAFLASIAHLPPSERQRKIERRAWYRRLAERQGVIEAEWQAEQNLRK
jgi:hypothetical protein